MIYTLTMELPPTLNEIIDAARESWQKSAAMKKQWTNKITAFVAECEIKFLGQVWLEFHWYLTNFGRDADNVAAASKFIMDGVANAKTIRNDNLTVIQSPVLHYYHRSSQDNGVIMRISESPDFLLENIIDANRYSSCALQECQQKIKRCLYD
ncbi:hypothetical protein DSM106972_048940 [Dulcicalothrix desertica PCC 7102]|uniref:Uncharacterized protein n=1 Tax=Dulcicalothrix desertica PCC 7102 TaxID=232991 RepID=A0A3S1CBK1_9CYAN|nr:hypothetical protein [Dulcicalothrix desertica]RUT03980.1 hypothetical protein DSM106972_048940 [Dulcicalothrix desertica PCC 7102]TWH43614.1 hypothetical protein CAL7102_07351 [Dulcicalothrix desertica PCC 7102]